MFEVSRRLKHPADETCERAEAELAAMGAHADATVNPLTGERNALVHPCSQEERAADGEADGSGEEMAEAEEEAEQEEVHAEEAPAEEADAEEGEAEGEGAVEGETEGAAEGAEADGGEGGEAEREADGGEGGELAVAEKPWAPKDTEELLDAIATQDYGISDDRSAKLATPAIKAYNAVADRYHQTLQKRGQPLHEGFTIVKVRAARVADPAWWLVALFGIHALAFLNFGDCTDAHACARFPEVLACNLTLRRLHQMHMHVLALLNH